MLCRFTPLSCARSWWEQSKLISVNENINVCLLHRKRCLKRKYLFWKEIASLVSRKFQSRFPFKNRYFSALRSCLKVSSLLRCSFAALVVPKDLITLFFLIEQLNERFKDLPYRKYPSVDFDIDCSSLFSAWSPARLRVIYSSQNLLDSETVNCKNAIIYTFLISVLGETRTEATSAERNFLSPGSLRGNKIKRQDALILNFRWQLLRFFHVLLTFSFWPRTKLPLNWKRPGNGSLLR